MITGCRNFFLKCVKVSNFVSNFANWKVYISFSKLYRNGKNILMRRPSNVVIYKSHVYWITLYMCVLANKLSILGFVFETTQYVTILRLLLYSKINLKSYCSHFLYCLAQLSWLDFAALYRPLRRVTLSLLCWYEPKWRAIGHITKS